MLFRFPKLDLLLAPWLWGKDAFFYVTNQPTRTAGVVILFHTRYVRCVLKVGHTPVRTMYVDLKTQWKSATRQQGLSLYMRRMLGIPILSWKLLQRTPLRGCLEDARCWR